MIANGTSSACMHAMLIQQQHSVQCTVQQMLTLAACCLALCAMCRRLLFATLRRTTWVSSHACLRAWSSWWATWPAMQQAQQTQTPQQRTSQHCVARCGPVATDSLLPRWTRCRASCCSCTRHSAASLQQPVQVSTRSLRPWCAPWRSTALLQALAGSALCCQPARWALPASPAARRRASWAPCCWRQWQALLLRGWRRLASCAAQWRPQSRPHATPSW